MPNDVNSPENTGSSIDSEQRRADHLSLLETLLKEAKQAGAETADAMFLQSKSLSVSVRLQEPEKTEREESNDLGLRVFVGKRQAMVSTTDLRPEALKDFAARAVAMACAVPEDEFCGLAHPDQIASSFPELESCDYAEPSPEMLLQRAQETEAAALSISGVTNSEGADASYGRSSVLLAGSHGFVGGYDISRFGIGVAVLAGEGAAMERDYDYSSVVFDEDLEKPQDIGHHAGERVVKRLHPRKVKTIQAPIIFDPRVSGGLIASLAGAINGASIARGTSFLKEAMGTQILPKGLTVIDDPHHYRGLRSKLFDAEGLANQKRKFVEDGVLQSWILDLRSARQLGLTSTGHAARGPSSAPSPSPTNFYLEAGRLNPQELISDIPAGLYVTEMLGQGVNGVTGDYSRGAAGFWIENGEIAYPVSEITVAGNLKSMLMEMTPANDLTFRYGTNAPTLRIEGMTIAGN